MKFQRNLNCLDLIEKRLCMWYLFFDELGSAVGEGEGTQEVASSISAAGLMFLRLQNICSGCFLCPVM